MKTFLAILTAAVLGSVTAAEYTVKQLSLHEGAVVENGVLKLDGKKAYATIPGTEDIAIASPGVTFACSIRPQFDARKGNSNEIMDSYFSKKGAPFILCRWAGLISSRVLNTETRKYDIERCWFLPKAGQWTHLAFVFEPVPGRENVWTQRFYVNGKLKLEKTAENFSPAAGDGPVELGKGWGGPWMFTGEMADITVEQKILSPDEIAVLAARSRAANSRQ
ncbi:MAG: LamG domain-containing protein [Lentisphaeria bacterium]|nr:LamG domain-containing protein [Lentisphaeria bacterium]